MNQTPTFEIATSFYNEREGMGVSINCNGCEDDILEGEMAERERERKLPRQKNFLIFIKKQYSLY